MIAVLIALAWLQSAMPAADRTAQPPAVESEVLGALQRYSAALGSLDATAVKKVQPSIDLDSLKKAFRDMRSLEVAIDEVKVLTVDAAGVRVSCRVTQTLTPKGGARQTVSVVRVIRLRNQENGWVIEAFER